MNILLFDPMSLITPDYGLVFWTTALFILFWAIAGKYAFKPISEAIKKREQTIADALSSAERAKDEMKLLKADNENLLKQAREERALILKEAKDVKDGIIADAQLKATKIKDEAIAEIEKQKVSAVEEVKHKVSQEVSKMALDIAEKVLGKELDSSKDHAKLVDSMMDKFKLN